MGYDLHVTRADHWTDAVGHEITTDEWGDVIRWDPDLHPDRTNGPNAVTWIDNAQGHRGWFDWSNGVVYTSDPNPATVEKMITLASRLEARVQGDNGEFYEGASDWPPRTES